MSLTNGEPRPGLEGQAEEAGHRLARGIAFGFGVVMHLMIGAVYVAAGLVAPPLAVLALWAVWIALAVAMWRNRRRVVVVLAIPFLAAAIWAGTLWLGETFLGWTA